MTTRVGDSTDSSQGIRDLWVGDAANDSRHAVHAWVGNAANDPVAWDVPTRLTVVDSSFCDPGFPPSGLPRFNQDWAWDNLHFGNVAFVELWVDGSERVNALAGTSGARQQENQVTSLTVGTYDCKVRYEYSDGTHSPFSNIDTVTVSDPCS